MIINLWFMDYIFAILSVYNQKFASIYENWKPRTIIINKELLKSEYNCKVL